MHSDDPTLAGTGARRAGWHPSEVATQPSQPSFEVLDRVRSQGELIGRFVVQRLLGQGGMGVVYAARDPELGREVAIKVLHGGGHQAELSRQRLLREAQSMARVAHPNLVMVFEVGTVGAEVFIAMELVDGVTLGEWAAQHRGDWAAVVRAYVEAARGLQAVHEAGLVHRDFKPANALVRATGRVQVLDFGIARSAYEVAQQGGMPLEQVVDMDLTATGALMGTPAYMAPEQVAGEAVTPRSDQFAVAVSLYESMFGTRPFGGQNSVATLRAIWAAELPAWPRQPTVPNALKDVVTRALSKDPSRRYPSMAEFADALEASISSRRVVPVVVGAVGALVVVSGAVAWVVSQRLPENERPKTEVTTTSSPLEQVTVAGESGEVSERALAPAPGHDPVVAERALAAYRDRRNYHSTESMWTAAAEDLAKACGDGEVTDENRRHCAAEKFALGLVALERDEAEKAEREFRSAIAIDGTWAEPHVALCHALRRLDRFDDAMAEAVTAQSLDGEWFHAVVAAADVHTDKHQLDEAIDELRRALRMEEDHPEILSNMALVFHARGLDSEAERFAEKALAVDEELAPVHILLAERALERGEAQDALRAATRATGIEVDSAPAWLARADALLILGRDDEARAAFEKTIELVDQTKEHGAPELRIIAVRLALRRGELPSPRGRNSSSPSLETRSRKKAASPGGPPPSLDTRSRAPGKDDVVDF